MNVHCILDMYQHNTMISSFISVVLSIVVILALGVHGFELVDPSTKFADYFSFSIDNSEALSISHSGVTTGQSDSTNTVSDAVKKHIATITQMYGEKNAENILNEVSLMAKNADYKTVTWTMNINRNSATMEAFAIVVKISSTKTDFSGGRVIIEQPVPRVTKQERVCAKTGSRRYGICGPRREECNTVTVDRGLYEDEIEQIKKNLIKHSYIAQNKLIGDLSNKLT